MTNERPLRSYKGWVYDPDQQLFIKNLPGGLYCSTPQAFHAIGMSFDLRDEDHASLMDLMDSPYEHVEAEYETASRQTHIPDRIKATLLRGFPIPPFPLLGNIFR